MNESERKIAELIEAKNGNITAREIAISLNFSTSMVSKTAKKYNLKIIKTRKEIYKRKLARCENRPQGCFECEYNDCICNSKKNEQETEFMFAACMGEKDG